MTKEEALLKREGYVSGCWTTTTLSKTECEKRAVEYFPLPKQYRVIQNGTMLYRMNAAGEIEYKLKSDEKWYRYAVAEVATLLRQMLNDPLEEVSE